MTTIYYNPRCSKCRQTRELLEERSIEPEIIEYLNTPPTQEQLIEILSLLNLRPRELMRKGESEYKALGLDDPALSDDQLIEAMVTTPKLIERPIVIHEGKAIIGRPPERVVEIL